MANRRQQPISRSSTFRGDHVSSPPPLSPSSRDYNPQFSKVSTFKDSLLVADSSPSASPSSSLAAKTIRASARRDFSSTNINSFSTFRYFDRSHNQDRKAHEFELASNNEQKFGFWGVLAKQALSIVDDENIFQKLEEIDRSKDQIDKTRTVLDAMTVKENKPAQMPSEARKLKLNIRRKGGSPTSQNNDTRTASPLKQSQNRANSEIQLKASRDVAMAMAAKAKVLLRELNTMKADLAFAKERCAQLEEENKILRDSSVKGVSPEDDDLIRHQLETLLAEKSRLANENSVYARDNRFLREVVEYHHLTMQDLVYCVDEDIGEVTEVYPIPMPETPVVDPTNPTQHHAHAPSESLKNTLAKKEPRPTTSPLEAKATCAGGGVAPVHKSVSAATEDHAADILKTTSI